MNNKNNNIMPVGAINHDDEHRASIPTTELAGEESLVAENMSPEGKYNNLRMNLIVDVTLNFIGLVNIKTIMMKPNLLT